MTEEANSYGSLEEPLFKILEQQARYGMDQETMLLYLSSVNLMSILTLHNRRYGGSAGLVPSALPLPPAAAGGMTGDNMLGMLLKMLGNQQSGADDGPGQGANPAALLNLLASLSQNVDLGKVMSMLAGMGTQGKAAGGQQQETASAPVYQDESADTGESKGKEKSVADRGGKREIPKIMKWDQLK
ncbi:MAG: hypothetical protein ACOX0T_09410 [Pelotomaculum sp.]|jgi:hypothetical protein